MNGQPTAQNTRETGADGDLSGLRNWSNPAHVAELAVDPLGQARSDLDIFLDYATRMDFRDGDGNPLIGWHDPESAFDAWKL